MSETFVCDCCDDRIQSGYTVCWASTLTNSASGIHFSGRNETRNICHDCWPQEKSVSGRVRQLLARLGLRHTGGESDE